MERLGRMVLARRTECGWSRAKAATVSGVGDQTWLDIENGKKRGYTPRIRHPDVAGSSPAPPASVFPVVTVWRIWPICLESAHPIWQDRAMGELMYTFKRADDQPVAGEYSFVTDFEWFEDDREYIDKPYEVIKETWRLVKSESVTITPKWAE